MYLYSRNKNLYLVLCDENIIAWLLPKIKTKDKKNRRNKSENARLSTGVLDFIAQKGYAFARAPNLRILALSGERMNAGAVNWKAPKVRPQKENEPSNATACAAVFSFKLTAKIFAFAKRFA